MAITSPAPFQSGDRLINGDDLNKNLANPIASVDKGAVALGTNLATAYRIGAMVTQFATVAASTGCYLDAAAFQVGQRVEIYNDGASPLTVYANNSATIDGTAGATGVALANAKRCQYTLLANGVWESAQLGAVSA